MPPTHPLRVAVIGAGAFGRNHLRVYRELEQAGEPIQLAAVVDNNPATAAEAAAKFNIPGFATIEAALAATKPDAASVCVPTIHHASTAAPLLAAGVDLLIEKPIAQSLADADRILDLSRKHNRIVQPGHLERFNPAVTAARQHLFKPMFFEGHRLSIFTPRSLDVDVVLDLMIHDLDIVLSFVASPVREVRAVGLPVLSPRCRHRQRHASKFEKTAASPTSLPAESPPSESESSASSSPTNTSRSTSPDKTC